MHSAWQKFGSGKVPWADLARAGDPRRAGRLRRERRAGDDARHRARALREVRVEPRAVLPQRRAAARRRHARNPDLAWTLEQIAKGGADGFYNGEVARRMVTDLRGKGNAMRLTDLVALLRGRARAGERDVPRLHGVLERAARARRRDARRAAQPARAVADAEPVHRRRGDAARDDRRVAARADRRATASPTRRSGR